MKIFRITIDHTENEWKFDNIRDINGRPGTVTEQFDLGDGFYELLVKF